MKILHVVAGDLTGGAARGAYWLHLGLRDLGIDSKIITNSTVTFNDKNIISLSKNTKSGILISIIKRKINNLAVGLYRNRKKIIFNTGFDGLDFTKTREYQEADIVHLHWINGFVDIKHLSKISKPIVWTMRDMWPMTGGCHYTMGCERYKFGCGKCSQLSSSLEYDLSKIILNRKKKYFPKDIKFVGISNWLSEKAKESYLLKDFDIVTIHNSINTKEFFPIEKQIAKTILGISTNTKIILAGAKNVNDFYKGFGKLLDAIQLLEKERYCFCFFGNFNAEIVDKLDIEYINFGYLHDNISLRLLYSAADVFVASSIMDAFGKTLVESMACGTPVVCFDATGPKDIVDHLINGYKASPFDSVDLAQGINWILTHSNYASLSQNAREKVSNCFDNKIVAKQYIGLYRSLVRSLKFRNDPL